MRGIVFTHSGSLGGILFSLHFGGERDVVQTIEQSPRLPDFLFR